MKTVSLALALVSLSIGSTTQLKAHSETQHLAEQRPEWKAPKETPDSQKTLPAASDRNDRMLLTTPKLVWKDGGLFVEVSEHGVLVPIPGGGASGCFGRPPMRSEESATEKGKELKKP